MKTFVFIFALLAFARADLGWNTPMTLNSLRGGASIGPLDEKLALQLAKTATVAFVAGSGSKYVASQTNGRNTQLADFVTKDLFALNALITAVSTGMFKLSSTGFDSMKVLAAGNALALLLKLDSDGIKVDTLMENKAQAVITILYTILAVIK